MWHSSHGNSGLTIVQSHHTQRTCGTHLYLPSICFRFTGRLLSLCGFPLQVSRCSEGYCSQPPLSLTGIPYAPTRRTSICQRAPIALTISGSVVPLGAKTRVVRFLVGIGEAATNEHPMVPIIFPSMQHRYASPVKKSGTLGSFAHREALPIMRVKPEGFHFTDLHPSALPIKS
jgi:hypothetical protein